MSVESPTALDVAEAKHAATITRLEAAKNALSIQIADAEQANAEVRRIRSAITAGDTTEARALAGAQTHAAGQTDAVDAFRQAIVVAERNEQAARLDVLAETLKSDHGDLLTPGEQAELEAEAMAKIHAIAFDLAEKLEAHNRERETRIAEVRETQNGLAPNTSVAVIDTGFGSSFKRTLFIDGQPYAEVSPRAAIDRTVWNLSGAWSEAHRAEAIAAQDALRQAKLAEDAEWKRRDLEMRYTR